MEKYRFCRCGKPVQPPYFSCQKHRDIEYSDAETSTIKLSEKYQGMSAREIILDIREKNRLQLTGEVSE